MSSSETPHDHATPSAPKTPEATSQTPPEASRQNDTSATLLERGIQASSTSSDKATEKPSTTASDMSYQEKALEPTSSAETAQKIDRVQELIKSAQSGKQIGREEYMNIVGDSRSLILDDATKAALKAASPMTPKESAAVEKQLGIPGISKELNITTTGITSQVASGYFRFDAKCNGWVDPQGGRLTLWPENISAIERYLKQTAPDHPYLKRTSDKVTDSAGKYAYSDTLGMGINTALSELQYNEQYRSLQVAGKAPEEIQQILSKNHAVNIGANAAVEAFVQQNPKGYIGLSENNTGSSEFRIPQSEFGKNIIRNAIKNNGDMEKVLDDIVAGHAKYDSDEHTWNMVSKDGSKKVPLEFTVDELTGVCLALLQTKEGRNHPFFADSMRPSGSLKGYNKEEVEKLRRDF